VSLSGSNGGSFAIPGAFKYNTINELSPLSENFMADNLAGVVKTTFEVNLDIPNIQIEQVAVDREGHYRMTVQARSAGHLATNVVILLIVFIVTVSL
jgi:hypothetical protein